MRRDSAAILIAQPFLWSALILAGLWYAREREVPLHITMALLPAFLYEVAMYVASASEWVRTRLSQMPRARLAILMTAASAPSYLIYTIPLGLFRIQDILAIAIVSAIASFWYVLFERRPASDIAFLALLAAPVLFKLFDPVYPDVPARIPSSALGIVMWYRTGLLALLVLRTVDGIGFGLMPRRSEWAIGLRNYFWFLPVGIVAAIALNFVRPTMPSWTPRLMITAVIYFFGTLWFLAVAEEFFFRGLLQQTLTRLLQSKAGGLLLASVVFGLAHLGFRDFPNWRFAILVTVTGLFYGRAYLQAGTIRAAMVTHALVVTTWRVFLM